MRNTSRWGALLALALLLTAGCGAIKRYGYGAPGSGRDAWQQPERVVEALEIQPGDRVADLGAGGGYFTFRLADAVGSQGVVYAVDVDPAMTEYLNGRTREEGRRNVKVILGEPDDALLPKASVDLVLIVNTYHHLSDRRVYFERLAKALRRGGRVAIVEYDGGGWFGRLFGHSTQRERIETEMTAAGYRLAKAPDFLTRQSFLIFSR